VLGFELGAIFGREPCEHLILEDAREHMTVHEGGRIAEHLAPLDACVIGQAFGEEIDQRLRRLSPGHPRIGRPMSGCCQRRPGLLG